MYRISVFCFLVLVGLSAGKDKHFIDDCDNPGDNPVVCYQGKLSQEGEFFKVQENTERCPNVGLFKSPITCISVKNLDSEADGGYPSISSGGIGYMYVDLYLKSQMGKGYNFDCVIYCDGGDQGSTPQD